YPRACTVWEQTSSSLAPHLTEIFFFCQRCKIQYRCLRSNASRPSSRTVTTEQMWGPLKVTKDEIAVARSTDLKDKYKMITPGLIGMLLTHRGRSWGSTTTVATLAHLIITESVKKICKDVNPAGIRKGAMLHVDAITLCWKLPINHSKSCCATGVPQGEKDLGMADGAASGVACSNS
uniref:Uncharacterized protein n=1 Tax=Sus scrofa TaxID=9823 RepID=A0A8D0WDL9_PIG